MYEKSAIIETVASSSFMVKKEVVEPEQQPKHIIQSHEPKPQAQESYNKQKIKTSTINEPVNIQGRPISEALHKCDHCSYSTVSKENLQKHAKIHYVCVYCKHIAASEVSLLLHVSKHASGKPKTYARRSYPGKRQNQDVQGKLYEKHGVKEESVDVVDTRMSHRVHEVKVEPGSDVSTQASYLECKAEPGSDVSTQASYIECKVKEEHEYTHDVSTATTSAGLHTRHALKKEMDESPFEFQKPKQLWLKEGFKRKVTQAQAGMCTEHETGNEPEGTQADHIEPEVKQEPGSEMGLQAQCSVVLEEQGLIFEGALRASLDTKQRVKNEPVNEAGSMEHAVKEECISETTQADVPSEDIQAAHVMQVFKRKVTQAQAGMCTEHEAGNEPESTQADYIKPEVKQEPGSEMCLQAQCSVVLEEQGLIFEGASCAGLDTKQRVKEEPVNEAGSMEHAVKEECISETSMAELWSEDIQTAYVKQVPEKSEFEVKKEPESECAQDGAGEAAGGVSASAARAGLYPGHAVKEELVLGPEELSTPKWLLAGSTKQEDENEEPVKKSVMNSLILHSAPVTEKSHKYYESSKDNEKPRTKKKISYKCAFCSFESANKKDLQNHQMIHIGEEPYKCTFCNYSAFMKRDLTLHLRTHSRDKPYKCAHCSYGTADKICLRSHVKKHAQWKPYKCVHCSYVCAYKSQLRAHENKHTGTKSSLKSHICTVCGYACNTTTLLKNHYRIHTGEKVHKCVQCNFATNSKGYLKVHERKHTGEKPYKCTYCSYVTDHGIYLKIHLRKHTGEKPYKCSHCSFAAVRSSALKTHLSIHTGEQHKCAFCSYVTENKVRLREHERTHTAEKVHKCALCSFASAYKNSLKLHVRTHTGEKPYKCSQCDDAFTQQHQLKFHEIWSHTDREPYKCGSCSYTTKRTSLLRCHIQSHHGNLYKCAYCTFASPHKKRVLFHERRKHTGENLYKCAHCNYKCLRIYELNAHVKTHSIEEPYRCAHCSYASVFKSYLRRHLQGRSGDKSHQM